MDHKEEKSGGKTDRQMLYRLPLKKSEEEKKEEEKVERRKRNVVSASQVSTYMYVYMHSTIYIYTYVSKYVDAYEHSHVRTLYIHTYAHISYFCLSQENRVKAVTKDLCQWMSDLVRHHHNQYHTQCTSHVV